MKNIILNKSKIPINIPNILSVIRILLVPLFVISLFRDFYGLALLIFAIAAISDVLDGLLASSYLDPVADKLLLVSAFIILAVVKMVPGWLAVIVISRDILIILGVVIFSIENVGIAIKPSIASKCTTVAQVSTILFVLLNPAISGSYIMRWFLYWITAGLTITSGLHYL
ncbi:MAG: CDP-diacylglycerol--glycerol-3-phosphate 3-phosphatidyltransferase, partial [Deltaproteobacteria bacterium]|nr:CDP-diacylglycerol--glycerol-3-phosphate 3-phosphatidyltransferase [Deltaproteobacteria bacterium]